MLAAFLTGLLLAYLIVPDVRARLSGSAGGLFGGSTPSPSPDLLPLTAVSADGRGTATHEAPLAVDGDLETYWVAQPTDQHPTLTVRFARDRQLRALVIHAGGAPGQPAASRPSSLRLTFPDGAAQTLRLADQADQKLLIEPHRGAAAELEVLSVYGGEGAPPAGIREVEFLGGD